MTAARAVALLVLAAATAVLLARPTAHRGVKGVQLAADGTVAVAQVPLGAPAAPAEPPPPTTTVPPATTAPTAPTAPTTEAPTPTTEAPTPAPEPDPTPEAGPEGTSAEATGNAVPEAEDDSQPQPGGGWALLRECESGGDYGAVQRGGPGRGAYQFDQSTWDAVARHLGRADLVGVAPHEAAPADQDTAALALYDESGSQPWPYCGRYV